jgi:hypothetical protein
MQQHDLDDTTLVGMVRSAVRALELDLRGAVVATEAGTKAFLAPPLLALAAGAECVFTVTRNTAWGSRASIHEDLVRLVGLAELDGSRLATIASPDEVRGKLDVITNLASLRPIDERWLARSSPHAVVPYMCEAWEVREGDVDFEACNRRSIPVAGQEEDFDGMAVFESVGQLAVKMCFEAGLGVRGDRIVVLSRDRFGAVASRALEANGAHVVSVSHPEDMRAVTEADGVLVADYSADEILLDASIGGLARGLRVVQLAGRIALDELRDAGAFVYPGHPLPARRMSYTLSHLAMRPTVNLLAQGLKVGEVLWRHRKEGVAPGKFEHLVQPILPKRPFG